jgi:hypothetical protein
LEGSSEKKKNINKCSHMLCIYKYICSVYISIVYMLCMYICRHMVCVAAYILKKRHSALTFGEPQRLDLFGRYQHTSAYVSIRQHT